MLRGCICSCHASITEPYPIIGFDANEDVDVIAAATACSKCLGLHTRIFEKPPKRPLPLLLPYSTDSDGDTKGEGAES